MFRVTLDEEFYIRFKVLENAIQRLSDLFQNPNIEITAEEFGEWNKLSNDVKKEIDKIIKEANNRINVILD